MLAFKNMIKFFNLQSCMIDKICPSFWTNWSNWNECDVECGSNGRQKRVRICQEFYTNKPSNKCNGTDVNYKKCSQSPRCAVKDTYIMIPYPKHGKARLVDMTKPNSSLCLVPFR